MKDMPPLGESIRGIRKSKGLRFSDVKGYVAISTISAIERGLRIPSLSVLDSITEGLGEPVGIFDLEYLACANEVAQRQAVYNRLVAGQERWLAVQATLRRRIRYVLRKRGLEPITRHDGHVLILLADLVGHRHQWHRVTVLLRRALQMAESLGSDFRGQALSLLGSSYLQLNRPAQALKPLLEATHASRRDDAWESSVVNLGLAWWELGHYEEAQVQWLVAVEKVTDEARRANALMGLGSVALRQTNLQQAQKHFLKAYALYKRSPTLIEGRARAVNNLLVVSVRSGRPQDAATLYEEATRLQIMVKSLPLRGEILESMAEWAAAGGDTTTAMTLIKRAKECLGQTPVLSWFSVRFLESQLNKESYLDVVDRWDHDFEGAIEQVSDQRLVAALRLRGILLALVYGDSDWAKTAVQKCMDLFPPVGGFSWSHDGGQDL